MEKKILVVALMALLVFGLVVVVSAVADMEKQGRMGFFRHRFGMDGGRCMNKTMPLENLGLPGNASREEVQEAIWQKRLADLGLAENSTLGEYRGAMRAEMQERRREMLENIGLGENATAQEIWEARKAYCEENHDDCPCKMKAGLGRGMGRPMI